MKNLPLKYIKLISSDEDIPFLKKVHSSPEISEFISIDTSNYFNYVTSSDNVFYYKVILENEIVASIHLESENSVLHISILTLPQYQKNGIATQIIDDVKAGRIIKDFHEITVSVDKDNIASIRLFKKSDFKLIFAEDELLIYSWVVPNS